MSGYNNKIYDRKRGSRSAVGQKVKTITFSWVKLDINQGQPIDEWEKEGLLSIVCEMMRQVGQYGSTEVFARRMIKQYTQVGFPPNSEFKEPKHVSPTYWAVIHIKPKSKEVVVGFLEEEVFYIIFLDKDHKFWPTKDIQDRGKNRR